MSEYKPHPSNAPGDFYVAEGHCITCLLPESEAPDLIGLHSDTEHGGSHCYFKKQPSGASEIHSAIEAVDVSCCGALRYSGTDD